MSWKRQTLNIVRGLINDTDYENYTYEDERLLSLACICAINNVMEIGFTTEYTINICTQTITPEPDQDFIILMSLRTHCFIAESEYRDAANEAMMFKDGPSAIDGRDIAGHKQKLWDGACKQFNKAKTSFLVGDGSMGTAIVGPYTYQDDLGHTFN